MDRLTELIDSPWEKSLKCFKTFNINSFIQYVGLEGSSRLMNNGYKFSLEGYVRNIFTATCLNGYTAVKAVCFPSQRKNEPPRPLFFIANNEGVITESYCDCKAG